MDCAVESIRAFMAMDDELLEDMGKRGREFVAEKLSFELFSSKLVALAEEAKKNHSAQS